MVTYAYQLALNSLLEMRSELLMLSENRRDVENWAGRFSEALVRISAFTSSTRILILLRPS